MPLPVVKRVRGHIEVICDTARAFLQMLDPIMGLFTTDTFIFRGVDSSHHRLVPAAHRRRARMDIGAGSKPKGVQKSLHAQCAAELSTLARFFELAARQGIRIPEDSVLLRSQIEFWENKLCYGGADGSKGLIWPPAELYSLIGLAQHFHVPTRALDWTRSGYIAAYFAASPAVAKKRNDYISVWVFDDFIRRAERILEMADRPLVVFDSSGADNDNLRAQRGLFMVHRQELTGDDVPFKPRAYDTLLRESLPKLRAQAAIIRILTPAAESQSVLSLLADAGITAGSLFPGLWGIAREYEERQFLRSHPVSPARPLNTEAVWAKINSV